MVIEMTKKVKEKEQPTVAQERWCLNCGDEMALPNSRYCSDQCEKEMAREQQPTPEPGYWYDDGGEMWHVRYRYDGVKEYKLIDGWDEYLIREDITKLSLVQKVPTLAELQALRQQVKDKDEDIDELKKQLEDAWEHTAKASSDKKEE